MPDAKEHGFQFSKEATSLIKQLLDRNRFKRLGFGPGDFKEILSHKFFKGINVNKIKLQQFKAPYIPDKSSLLDLEMDPLCSKQLLESDDIPESIKKLIDQQQHNFKSFGKNVE